MPLTKTVTKIPGTGLAGGLIMVTDVVTLSSGAGEFAHGLKKCRVFCQIIDASAIAAETVGPVGTFVDGWLTPTDGITDIESSNGSSAELVLCMAVGYGG